MVMIGRLNSVKVTILPKLIYRFNASPTMFFAQIEKKKSLLKFTWNL